MIEVIGRFYAPAVMRRDGRMSTRVVYETTFTLSVKNWENFQREWIFARTQDQDLTYAIVLKDNPRIDLLDCNIGIERGEQATKKRRIQSVLRHYNTYLNMIINEDGEIEVQEEV